MNKGIFFFCILVLLTLGGRYCFLHVGDWLAHSESPQKADVILCLNGNPDRVPKVVELFKQGYADTILVTFPKTKTAVVKAGIPDAAVLSLAGGYNSTYEEALGAVRFMKLHTFDSAIIVSDPYHLYRVQWTYGRLTAADSIRLIYTASVTADSGATWWDDTWDRRYILKEVPKILYYWIAHGLLGVRHDPHWVNITEQWYSRMLVRFA